MKILIPTCHPCEHLIPMVEQLHATIGDDDQIIVSCKADSAAVNRNWCLDKADLSPGEIAIMLDDDISGFYPGWMEDLSWSLQHDSRVMVASARLMDPSGVPAQTCSKCYECEPEEIEVTFNGWCVIPTAAIAFRNRGHRFDENFIGSGFEDNDWMAQYLMADPGAKFIQSNRCRLTHANEMKNQKGAYWEHNKEYYRQKWFGTRTVTT